jgi:hypothetical protein
MANLRLDSATVHNVEYSQFPEAGRVIGSALYAVLPHPMMAHAPYAQHIDLGFCDPPGKVDKLGGRTRGRCIAPSVRRLATELGHKGPERAIRGDARFEQIWRGLGDALAYNNTR